MTGAHGRGGLAFWIHQAVEYLLGVLLVTQAVQSTRPAVPLLLGLALIALAATADGPLAAFHVVPRPLHRVLDLAVAAAVVVVAVVGRDALGSTGMVFAAVAVAALVALVWQTDYRPRRRAGRPAASAGPAPDPTAAGPSGGTAAAAPPGKGERYGRAAGRALGKGIRAYREPPG